MKLACITLLLFLLMCSFSTAQSPNTNTNPFQRFVGQWSLKDNVWETSFGGNYKSENFPDALITGKEINTKNSILFVEQLGSLQAHILWIYNFKTQQVGHLSNSSINSSASGKGNFKENGDLELKLYFEADCESCFRIYSYEWKGENEFFFKATYYKNDLKSGDFYSGTFIRKNP